MKLRALILFLSMIVVFAAAVTEKDLIRRKFLSSITLIMGLINCKEFYNDIFISSDESIYL